MNKKITIITATAFLIQLIFINQSIAFFGWYEKKSKPVAVIVNSELYPQVKDSIDRYLDDLKNEDYEVIFSLWDYKKHPNVDELKELLKGYHETQNLQGAVLIGKIPYAQGQMNGESGPIETYLMDLHSANFIKNDEGIITNFQRHIYMDIWVSRIWVQNNESEAEYLFPDESEADLINRYFEKNHLYRTCQSPVSDLKLKFSAFSKPTDLFTYFMRTIVQHMNSNEHGYDYVSTSGSVDKYLDFINTNIAQYLTLNSHSWKSFHAFEDGDYITSYRLKNVNIKQPFVILEACSASDFSHPRSLGNAYLFGQNSDVLVIAGHTVPGNIAMGASSVHSTGEAFGINFLNHIQGHNLIGQGAHFLMEPVIVAITILSFNLEDSMETKILELMKLQSISVLLNLVGNHFGLADSQQVGYTLLGDPTLQPYIDMDWCPEYQESN